MAVIFPLIFILPMIFMLAFDGFPVVAWTLFAWGILFIIHAHFENHKNYMRRMRGKYPINYDLY